jgi:hypothetical protein
MDVLNMKFSPTLLVTTMLLFSFSAVHAETSKGCAAKQQNIETQLKYAKARGNAHEVRGLQKALNENIEHCQDANLQAQREQKILEKQRKVSQIEAELEKQKALGNPIKIEKQRYKLKKAQLELDQAELQLTH